MVLVNKFRKKQQIDVEDFSKYDWDEGYFYMIKLTETSRALSQLKNL